MTAPANRTRVRQRKSESDILGRRCPYSTCPGFSLFFLAFWSPFHSLQVVSLRLCYKLFCMRTPTKSLSQVLAESHVSAVAIAVLLLWMLDWAVRGLWTVIVPVSFYVATAIAIRGIPYEPIKVIWTLTVLYLLSSFLSFAAAWLLSHWVYGMGPLLSLSGYGRGSRWRIHA